MEGSVQPSQTAGVSNPKPAPGPKPRLAPKPFSLQTNTTIRSIHAPKSIVDASKTATPQGVKSEDATVPKPAVPAPPLKPTTSVRAPTKEQGEPTKATEAGQAGRDASDGKSDPVPQTTPAVEKPKTAPLESDNAIENNRKTSADAATKLEREDESKKDGTSSTESQVLDESGSDTGNPAHRWGSTRKRLSMEITSRFEQGGGPPPAPSNVGKQATSVKHDVIRAECTNPEQNQTRSELPEREGEESGPKEDYVGGGSIKRRISLLFDSRPEVTVKREEPEMINGTGGVKARIKNWVMDTVPEKKPQFVPRPRLKSTETSTPAEKTPETPPTEPPTSSSQVADLPSTSLPVHQPTEGEVSGKHKETEATEDGQSLIFSQAADHTDETDSANNALKRDNSKRRSVHFGVVEKDDGGPPVILGPESDSSEEEEEGQEKEDAEADVPVSVPVYRRVGLFQKDGSAEAEEAEKLHHLEFEKKRRAEETEEARRTIEEHKRKEEEEGKEREKERQLEIERVRNEKRQRLEREQERVRLEEEEREKERLREEEIKRMRLEEEEREKERLRQEQLEKQRIALERMRLEEEEKERLRKEEMERERKELERMRLEEEEKERLRKEEMERERKELERMRLEEEEKERLRKEEMEKRRMELERRLEEEEREKEKLRKEMERQRMELERRLEEEEREKEKLRKEMERQRMELERRLEEEEREKEKLRKEMERQRMELERRLEEEENEKERMRREMERQMELDTIRMEEEERQKERLKENEMERHREEWERVRWEEEHREKENIKEEEIERERRIHQLWHRQKEEIEMMETEDIPQEERESKRLWLERERQRLRKEEEERVIHESDEHKFESKLREEEINIEKQREEEWENHWVSKVERLKEENEEKNDPSLMWQSRKEEERDKYTRLKEEQDLERGQKEKEDILICFDSGKSSDSHRSPTQEDVEVVYEDFSIKKNLLEVEFDDFSVKPVKSGGGARDEISAVVQDGGQGAAADAPSEEDEEVDVSMFKWEYKAKQQVESADTREPAASQERGEEEEQLIFSTEITSPSTTQEEPKQEEDAHEVKDDTREEPSFLPHPQNPFPSNNTKHFLQRGRSHGDPGASETTRVSFWTMQYLGGKLSAAQLQVAGWVGNVRRSLQGALDLVWGSAEDKQEEEQDEGVDGGGRFQRAVSPLRNFARRSRRSLRRLSTRSRTTVHRKAGETRSAEDNSCTNVKEKGAEVLIDGVPDEQNEAPDQPSETDSSDPESDHHLEISSEDLDTTDFRSETDVAPFPESSTPLLDSSAQKSKADLSKRMSRTRPSRSLRAGLSQGESPDWRISDSSVLSSKQRESDSEDEQPKQKIFSPHPTSQRVPIFPGLSPAALIAQIKRKTGGKVEETLDDNGREEKEAGAAPSPSQLSSSPRTAAHLTGATRVLPPLPGTDEGATACPPWLKELKSKKRLSQYDGEP
eukprot:XP_011612526.1 PREDICTED: calponin homology domain-containing protein DDB_G0272472-like [Takifugu rubripes]